MLLIFNFQKVKNVILEDNFKISDIDYLAKIMSNFPVAVLNKYCAVFISHPKACSAKFEISDIWPVMDMIMQKVKLNNIVSLDIINRSYKRIKDVTMHHLYKLAVRNLIQNDKKNFKYIVSILQKNFDGVDVIKKLIFLEKIRILPFFGRFLLFIRRHLLFFINNRRFANQRKKVNDLFNTFLLG